MGANQLLVKSDLEARKKSCIASIREGKWWTLQNIEPQMQDCEDVVLFSVERYGNTLKYASDRLRSNIYVVLVAITENKSAFQFAGEKLKKDVLLDVIANIDDNEIRARFCSKYKDMLSVKTFSQAISSESPSFFSSVKAIKPVIVENNEEQVVSI